MAESDYSKYIEHVKQICDSGNLENFKNNKVYGDILEHVSYEHGLEYLECIKTKTSYKMKDVVLFCLKNDSVGLPHRSEYVFEGYGKIKVSPTSLRYVYQSYLILTHLQALGKSAGGDVVEIGGGYGGLCVALYHFIGYFQDVKINRYTILDLSEVIRLQEMFHRAIGIREDIQYVDASTHGKDIETRGMFCISNYCYSEISGENQHGYCYWLFPKVSHGFMCWNNSREPSLPFEFKQIREEPNTGEYNKFIYF
jgi:hypothetical protein